MSKSFKDTILNNNVILEGTVENEPELSHEVFGEKFYLFNLKSERISGVFDYIPVMISERLDDLSNFTVGANVYVTGQFRSYNEHIDGKYKLILYVFAREIEFIEELSELCNGINIDGYLCKEPKYRKTPLGREIVDIIVAVNRTYGKSDYIPCIAWGRNARMVSKLSTGERVKISGRIQSREYTKKINENNVETRVAYEVSVAKIEVIEDGDGVETESN